MILVHRLFKYAGTYINVANSKLRLFYTAAFVGVIGNFI